jgi:hypothetical protein
MEHNSVIWKKQKAIIVPVLKTYSISTTDYIGVRIYDDLAVLVVRAPEIPNIGFRVRHFSNPSSLTEFVLSSDIETELKQIEEGNGAWFAFFQIDANGDLPHWTIVDLDGFRLNKCRAFAHSRGSKFVAYRVAEFPAGILIAAGRSICTKLPSIYPAAMSRRQSGAWEPYKGLPALIELRKGATSS